MSLPTGNYNITVPRGVEGLFNDDGSVTPGQPLLILPPSENPGNSKVRQAANVMHSFLLFPDNFGAMQWLVETVQGPPGLVTIKHLDSGAFISYDGEAQPMKPVGLYPGDPRPWALKAAPDPQPGVF